MEVIKSAIYILQNLLLLGYNMKNFVVANGCYISEALYLLRESTSAKQTQEASSVMTICHRLLSLEKKLRSVRRILLYSMVDSQYIGQETGQ